MSVAERGAAATAGGGAARYQSGFGNHFATEALPGALPLGRNSPQRPAYGLYAEQFSGTAFTAPRHANRRSWLYRIRPAAVHGSFAPLGARRFTSRFDELAPAPNPLRWNPPPVPRAPTRLHRRAGDARGQRLPRQPQRLRHPLVRGEPLHDRALLP